MKQSHWKNSDKDGGTADGGTADAGTADADAEDGGTADAELYGSLSFLVRRTWLGMRTAIGAELRAYGLTTPQYATLGIAAKTPGCSNSDVARAVGSTRQSANEMLTALERDGLIERGPHPSDRRTQQIHLTPLGERRLTEAGAAVARREAALESAFSPEERRIARTWLDGMAAACDEPDGGC